MKAAECKRRSASGSMSSSSSYTAVAYSARGRRVSSRRVACTAAGISTPDGGAVRARGRLKRKFRRRRPLVEDVESRENDERAPSQMLRMQPLEVSSQAREESLHSSTDFPNVDEEMGRRRRTTDDRSSFGELGLTDLMSSRLRVMGFETPTPVQRLAIPRMLGATPTTTDIALQAHTGSGKTLAFLLPVMHHILPPELGGVGPPLDVDAGIFAVIVAPTRDLAMQIVRDGRRAAGGDVGTFLIAQGVGGANIQYQIDALKCKKRSKGKRGGAVGAGERALRPAPRCIVGTPGRLRELSKRGVLLTHASHVLVVDEADKMLKPIFFKDIASVAKHIGKTHAQRSDADELRGQHENEPSTAPGSGNGNGDFSIVSSGNEVASYLEQDVRVIADFDDEEDILWCPDQTADDDCDGGGGGRDYPNFPISSNRMTVLVSATMTPRILKQFDGLTEDPLMLSADGGDGSVDGTGSPLGPSGKRGKKDLGLSVAPRVQHLFIETNSRRHHVDSVRRAIHALDAQHVLVFMNDAKPLKDTVAKLNARAGDGQSANVLSASWISGDTPKVERANILARFRDDNRVGDGARKRRKGLRVLVVNDLVAHGLDFPKCDLVVNLELPSDAAHYAHRAGRTGRMGALGGAGVVLSIVVKGVDRFVIEDKIARELGIKVALAEIRHGRVTTSAPDGGRRMIVAPK